jgi:Tripartite tricarboxylate transporter family receptor
MRRLEVSGTHFAMVRYRGSRLPDLLANQIDLAILPLATVLALVRARSIKASAMTSDMRFLLAPDILIFFEMALPAMSQSTGLGPFAPRKAPRKVPDEIIVASAAVAAWARLLGLGMDIFPREPLTAAALAALQKAEANKGWPIIKPLGIKGE